MTPTPAPTAALPPELGPRARTFAVVLPALLTVVMGGLLYGFVRLNQLQLDKFRSYGGHWTTDMLPLKETQFFVAVALLGSGFIFFLAIALARSLALPLAGLGGVLTRRPGVTVAALAGLALLATALTSWLAIQHAPVLLDEMIYNFQAQLLERGKLYVPLSDVWEAFKSGYLVQEKGIWTGIYPWGHVAALLPGRAIGFAHLVPHLCAPLGVWLTYLLGKELFDDDKDTALLAAAVVATSPFIAFTCGTLHNVTTSMVLVTGGLYALVRATRRSSLGFAVLAGLLFGLDLHSRPYNAVSIAVPAGITALVVAIRLKKRPLRLALAFAVGLLPGIVLYLGINHLVTGDFMKTPAELSMKPGMKIFGFGEGIAHKIPHGPILAFGKAGTNLMRLTLWTSGSLVAALGVGGLLLGIRRRAADLLLLVPLFGLFGFYYFFYTSPGFDTGPLYYLDAVPLLALALGRVVSVVMRPDAAQPAAAERKRWVAAGATAALVFSLLVWWPIQGLAINKVTDNTLLPYRAVDAAGIHDAVVWFSMNPWRRSWSLPARPPQPDLGDDVLFAAYSPSNAVMLWQKWGGKKKFYKLMFDRSSTWLKPWRYDDLAPYGPPAQYPGWPPAQPQPTPAGPTPGPTAPMPPTPPTPATPTPTPTEATPTPATPDRIPIGPAPVPGPEPLPPEADAPVAP